MLYYNRFQTVSFKESQTMLNYTANFNGVSDFNFTDSNAQNYIRIIGSTFKNMGFQQVHQALRYKKFATANSTEGFISTIPFRRFMDQGMILNLKGFSGSIEVRGSRFVRNIAYIQQVLISEYVASSTFYDFNDNEMIV